jgi:hypothetical protein
MQVSGSETGKCGKLREKTAKLPETGTQRRGDGESGNCSLLLPAKDV